MIIGGVVGGRLVELGLISTPGIPRSHVPDHFLSLVVHARPQLIKFVIYLLIEFFLGYFV